MVIKEISDILGEPSEDGYTKFYLGGERKEEILNFKGEQTGYSICEPKTGITGNKYVYNPSGERIGIINKLNEICDYNGIKTGFYIKNNKIKYNKSIDERNS